MKFFTEPIRVCGWEVPLRCYLPDAAPKAFYQKNRPAILVFPGGGYVYTYPGEAEPIALQYLAAGFCAFVLDYSVAPVRFPQALLEALTAIRTVREHAAEYGIDPQRISACGFSAGGHLAGCTGTLWNHPCLDGMLEGAREQYRPDAMVLSYPVLTYESHRDSYRNLLGENDTAPMREFLSLNLRVGAHTPPAFLWHTAEDDGVSAECSLLFAAAMRRSHIPFEIHVYENGGHGSCLGNYVSGFGQAPDQPNASAAWVEASIRFLLRH